MLSFILPPFLRGVLCLFFYMLIILVFGVFIYIIAFFKYLIPIRVWQKKCNHTLNHIPVLWTDANVFFTRMFTRLDVTLIGAENLSKNDWYLMTANHRSWTDVMILYRVFSHRIPVLKFFMKAPLLWVPIFGVACWLAGFPFMKRYTKEKIAVKPHLKGKDVIATKKLCSRFREDNMPMSIISFAEGTRYTSEKAKRQHTPFKNLLKPRAGALAYTLMALDACIDKFLNVTIVYPTGKYQFWDYVCGRVKRVVIKVECITLDSSLKGNYEEDPHYRVHFQQWLNVLWERKDKEIDELMRSFRPSSSHPL